MAQAILNFDESKLDKDSSLYDLYTRLYEGMSAANMVDAPTFDNPPLTEDGKIDDKAILNQMKEYKDILMKNSAYLFANSIIMTASGGGGSGDKPSGIGFIARSGDSMTGLLTALYGFQAGVDGNVILDVSSIDSKPFVNVSGSLSVFNDINTDGYVNINGEGLLFNGVKSIYHINDTLYLEHPEIRIRGGLTVDHDITIGNTVIGKNGIKFGNYDYYHSGNSNLSTVSWTMKDGIVSGTLLVQGVTNLNDSINALNGFKLGDNNKPLFYSANSSVILNSDLRLLEGFGVKLNQTYIIRTVGDKQDEIAFCAPGRIMNLGGGIDGLNTKLIVLKTGLYDSSHRNCLITPEGDGQFLHSFIAGCGSSDDIALKTFYDKEHYGIIVPKELRFNIENGPYLYGNNDTIYGVMPYKTSFLKFALKYNTTTSLFKDQSLIDSATLNLDTDAEFVGFNKPVEAVQFSIKSDKYKTRLIENTLFFDDLSYIEGLDDGIKYMGTAYFEDNLRVRNDLSSYKFASGFAGYGWAIQRSRTTGDVTATFDDLVVRKKIKAYEYEVQKISATNGSLWISDSCSGDEIRLL